MLTANCTILPARPAWYARAWATGCRFEGCSSGAQGGAVYLWHSAATLAASDFVNNSAPLDGGAGGALMVAGACCGCQPFSRCVSPSFASL